MNINNKPIKTNGLNKTKINKTNKSMIILLINFLTFVSN